MAKRFAAGIGLGALVYLGMALYADWEELQEALRQFRWWLILPVLGLSLGNYLIRFVRWQMYLGHARIDLPVFLSLRIFFAGLVMSVTPGKFGELLKAYLIKVENGAPMTRTAPIVVAERVTQCSQDKSGEHRPNGRIRSPAIHPTNSFPHKPDSLPESQLKLFVHLLLS
jgi:uncharacterized membrane protein YbhN (UPF0104 family)